jgi:hypothetical protein
VFKSQLTAQLPLQKLTPDILVAEGGNVHRWLTETIVHPHQGVTQHTDGCTSLGYSKAVTALLFRKLTTVRDSYSTYSGSLVLWGPDKGIMQYKGDTVFVPSICIFIRSMVHAFLLSELCSRDVMTVKKTYTTGSKRKLTLTSAYPPYNSYELNKGLREVIHACCRNKLHLIFGCDTSEHHIIWGSMDIN